ncbi:M20 family metallopeptidase [Nocardioides sp. GXQ0305]|uniref:M20 family metallopeptidase n=1 Tax=Nocardioides sp. GXQ0305 TaxID=3423912 RepID=UPI003D7D26F8
MIGRSEVEHAVLGLIEEDELVALTRELVRVPGENPPGQEEATAHALAGMCEARGLDVEVDEVIPGRPNVVASFGEGGSPGLLLLGHTDVVPVGTGWTRDPFAGELRDGAVHGRGSTDMKGGLAACLVAMAAVLRAGVRLPGAVHLAALVDEEDTGLGIRHLVDRGLPPLAGCVVAEPTDLRTVVAARGDSYLHYRVTGRAAHSGDPSEGRNAIVGAARLVADLEVWHAELAAARHPLVGPATVSVGTVHGGQGTSIVAAECDLTADRRLLPDEGPDAVLAEARARLDALDLATADLSAEVTMSMAMPGFATPADHPWPTLVDGALADAGGPKLPVAGWTAACDGGFVARTGVPVVVLGPGSLDRAHRADERVEVAQLVTAARAYALTLLRGWG